MGPRGGGTEQPVGGGVVLILGELGYVHFLGSGMGDETWSVTQAVAWAVAWAVVE